MNARSTADVRLPPFDLLVEDVGSQGCLGHVPVLPGCCFRAKNVAGLKNVALARISEYARWLLAVDLGDLTSETATLARRVRTGDLSDIQVIEAERLAGSPVWESGNPAVLFQHDLRPLDAAAVAGHLRFVRRVLEEMRELATPLSSAQRAQRPATDRRSVDETMEHIGNCVWWYCSRIDDELPEPDEPAGESPLDRIDRLFDAAEAHLPAVPFSARTTVHVSTRFPTSDPHERWTHTKVCRRQAEHVWAHLPGLKSAAAGALGSRV